MACSLLALPAELLLIILGELCESRYFPAPKDGPAAFRSNSSIYSISTVNRRLRLLCLPILFKITRCTSLERLLQLDAKCTVDPQFASLIRQLDIVDLDNTAPQQRLLALVTCLTSLVHLDLNVDSFNAPLLAKINSHPTLATVAIPASFPASFSQLQTLVKQRTSRGLPLSKILFSTTLQSWLPKVDIFSAMVQRGARFSRLTLEISILLTIQNNPIFLNNLIFRDLQRLDLLFDRHCSTNFPVPNWLLLFAERHTQLTRIKFTVHLGGHWTHAGVPFAQDFQAAMDAEETWGVQLNSFYVVRPISWSSLKDWKVDHIVLGLDGAKRISVLKVASLHAPHLSVLELIIRESEHPQPYNIDKFVAPFGYMPSLRTLHLYYGYAHLDANGQSPWEPGNPTGVAALSALQWYMTHVAQQATGLEVIHVTDQGYEGAARTAPWSLHASFRVFGNETRELEVIGSPKLEKRRGQPSRSYKSR
ncbi:hypothetical protein C8R45DRAFT_983883 [Mycena sanguinolenta]|nr:hypothetical protein C8R45DRAFT_983883 [Mycena sanguinolenta]